MPAFLFSVAVTTWLPRFRTLSQATRLTSLLHMRTVISSRLTNQCVEWNTSAKLEQGSRNHYKPSSRRTPVPSSLLFAIQNAPRRSTLYELGICESLICESLYSKNPRLRWHPSWWQERLCSFLVATSWKTEFMPSQTLLHSTAGITPVILRVRFYSGASF
jgi:hypothetical protein